MDSGASLLISVITVARYMAFDVFKAVWYTTGANAVKVIDSHKVLSSASNNENSINFWYPVH